MKPQLFKVATKATVREVTKDDESLLPKDILTAAWVPRITDDEPTKLLVEAWLCHEGMNDNRMVFRKEDFDYAASKIKSPNFLPMDWNHSAVLNTPGAPKAIGVWYEAEVADDQAAGGKRGIKCKGMVWAWAFPDQAVTMMEIQREKGSVDFSMACLSKDVEFVEMSDGDYAIALIEPVFFTHSALTVPPADRDATGVLTAPKEMWDALMASLQDPADVTRLIDDAVLAHAHREALMEEKALELALEQKAALEEKVASLTSDVAAKAAEAEALKAKTEDLAVKLAAAEVEATRRGEEITSLEAKVAELNEKVASFVAKEQEKEQAARWEARFTALPESFREAFAKKSDEERSKFETRWASASDEQWEEYLSDIKWIGEMRLSYKERSQGGALPGGTAGGQSLAARAAALTK